MEAKLERGLAELSLPLSAAATSLLLRHLELIRKWNKVYNLTAIHDPARMVVEHVLDSLSVVPYVRPSRGLDIGSGAGLPGIPLAIARPEWQVTLLDSSQKRCAFMRQAVIELGLRNVEVVASRIESFRPEIAYDTIVSRAFADTAEFAAAVHPFLADDGIMIAMKGLFPGEEASRLLPQVRLRDIRRIEVPGLKADRHLVIMTKT
jgi:16S rRNA (guanine527-N7)-methyltransferase